MKVIEYKVNKLSIKYTYSELSKSKHFSQNSKLKRFCRKSVNFLKGFKVTVLNIITTFKVKQFLTSLQLNDS